MEYCFQVCGVSIAVSCSERDLADLFLKVFGGFPPSRSQPAWSYSLSRVAPAGALAFARDAGVPTIVESLDELLFMVDKDITIALQQQRPDLLFVHAGVIAKEGRAWAISAPSGTGKSTTVWALVRDGLRYLSDELAPIELHAMRVHPYPRALNLKREPNPPYELPNDAVRFPGALYVPTTMLPCEPQLESLALHGMIFLRRDVERDTPRMRALPAAEAAIQIYANALNPLAHPGMGLDTAIAVAARVPCLEIELGSLPASAREIQRCMVDAID